MDQNASELIDSFISENFSAECQHDIRDTLALCDSFEYDQVYQQFQDILFDADADEKDATRLKVVALFKDSTDALFSAHQIELADEATLSDRNQILGVLILLQSIEDPTPILRILESSYSEEEQFSMIVECHSTLDQAKVLEILVRIEPSTLKILQDLLYAKEELLDSISTISEEVKGRLVKNLRDFFEVHGKDNLAHQMLENGIEAGYPLKLYYPYIHEHLISESEEETALNLLSLFYMSYESFNDPVKTYYKYSERLFTGKSITVIAKVESLLTNYSTKVRDYQKALEDAQRLT